jgi:DNA-binding NarL/FixJ family response regulator
MKASTLLLVEDHPLLAQTLARLLRERGGFRVAAVAGTAEGALETLQQLRVDLALVDVSLPRMSGIELVSEIRKKYPELPCLMISGHTTRHYVDHSLEAGARGYVVKDDMGELLEGIQRVLEGGTFLSKQLLRE